LIFFFLLLFFNGTIRWKRRQENKPIGYFFCFVFWKKQ
jgi:hypothetical protein